MPLLFLLFGVSYSKVKLLSELIMMSLDIERTTEESDASHETELQSTAPPIAFRKLVAKGLEGLEAIQRASQIRRQRIWKTEVPY